MVSNDEAMLHSPAWLAGFLYEFFRNALRDAWPERRDVTKAALRAAVRPEVREHLDVLWEERP